MKTLKSRKTLRKLAQKFTSEWQKNVRCAAAAPLNRLVNLRLAAERKTRISERRNRGLPARS